MTFSDGPTGVAQDTGGVPLPAALVDGHCHSVVAASLERAEFELFLTEADRPAPSGVSYADSPLGFAVRRWCAPILGLAPGAPLEEYLARRAELGPDEVRVRLLAAAGLSHLLVDTGIGGAGFASLSDLGVAASAEVREVVRLESVAERLALSGVRADDFASAYSEALREATRDAVAVKSILAYRHGFAVEPVRPSPTEVAVAARRWLGPPSLEPERCQPRLDDPVLLRFILWCGLDLGLPLQLHTGFGDRDLRLARVNPSLLQGLVEAAEPLGTPIVLLHCYPYHREAGWLAAVYPNVYVDVGLTLSHVGARATAVLAEFCELAPFGKLLYSSDAYGLAELYAAGASAFRQALGALLTEWWRSGALTANDAERMGVLVGAENARRLYQL
ncbi:amidohydrolase family protein [Actinopolymorpha alba]|uniref:amidohydrolase family protein n=1 Tax=Actinopolymorpha alba TaxID=533267 RepID=UPI0003662E35|nr:amidohydrolase family protein [Actinopolymorpha alba]